MNNYDHSQPPVRARRHSGRGGSYSSGIISMILIFTVLCMIVLSLLSYSTSQSDLQMSLRSMEQDTAYYDACTQAADVYSQLCEALSKASTEEEFYQICAESISFYPDLVYDKSGQRFVLDLAFAASQSLHIEFTASYPAARNSSPVQVALWQSRTTGSWTPDNRQQVYQKGETSS